MLQRDRQRQRERGTFSGGGAGALTAEYLVVAGGGGGSVLHSGGGGAGGYRSSVTGEASGGGASAETSLSIALGTPYAVTVGAGGASVPVSYSSVANKGNDSVFDAITSAAGGAGILGGVEPPGQGDGGSGGGGGAGGVATSPAGSGTADQGFNGGEGGNAGGSTYHGGGGGGAAEIGGNCTVGVKAGDGGDGVQSYITGSGIYRAGGGGGSSYAHPGGAGGLGGGGNGGGNYPGAPGTANTGGGGGAGGGASASNVSGAGGSGVVIIRVPSSVVAEFSAGVVYNYIPTDDFNVYEITAAGVSDTVTFSQGAVTTVEDSLRFNDDDSAYLTRTPASAGDRKTWTWSGWVKRGNLGTTQQLLSASSTTNPTQQTNLYFQADNIVLFLYDAAVTGTGNWTQLETSGVFRDPSAWYHIVILLDTTAAASSNRVKTFVNGVSQTLTRTSGIDLPLNIDLSVNSTGPHNIGQAWSFGGNYFDGYMSDVYFIDGEALDPSRFGKQDADGVWQPISYTGTYGTNGFHLDFSDNSTAAALGTDVSGNGNDWAPSGITTDDQVADTPSVNYATWNPLDKGANFTLSDGNLRIDYGNPAWSALRGNFGIPSGQWYWEVYSPGTYVMAGIATKNASLANYIGSDANGYSYYSINGEKNYNGSGAAYGDTWTVPSTIGIAFDSENGTLEFFNDGVSQGVAFTGVTPAEYFPAVSHYATSWVVANFGQRPFAYTPPTGFQALNSSNLPAPTITDGKAHFAPALYTGNGTTQAIGGLEFQPDFVWIKNRDAGYSHWLQDAVRGAQKQLNSDNTNLEYSYGNVLASFDTNGFTVNSSVGVNAAGQRHVAWNWNAGGSTVTNTDGTLTSQVRANPDAGFSIVTYTGNSTSGATVGHGLGSAPDLVIVKNRNYASGAWLVYHADLGSTQGIYLNNSTPAITLASWWNNTDPTASVFSLGNSDSVNRSPNSHVAYCFHSVDGFSKFGSYTGNGAGSDGPFIYTGFRPAFVIMKSNTNGYYWVMKDNKRAAAYNPATGNLYPNDVLVEDTTATAYIDLLANGFKLRGNYVGTNGFGLGYIYMAFAENPFKSSRAA